VATWRYCATDLLTGAVVADTLPLNVQSFGMTLNGSGTLTGSLNLSEVYEQNAPFVAALACRRAVIWALADGYPVWAGIQLDWPDMTRAQGTLPISAQTIDSLWGKRLITDTINYAGVDLFAAYLDLVTYGLTKNSSYISPVSPAATRPAAYLSMVATQGRVARLVLPDPGSSGVTWTASYAYSDLGQVSSAWSDMCASGNLEYFFEPGLDVNGNLAIFLRLGYTKLGRPLADTGLILTYPGNALDYGYTVTGSQSSNMVWATAPPNGSALTWQSQYPHGADLADLLANNYPLMESTASWQGSVVTKQSQVDAFADGQVAIVTAGMTTPVVNVGGSSWPRVKDLQLGDAAYLAFTSPLHPPQANGAPGLQQEVRITGITVYPPGPSQSEYYQLATSAVTAA
jgi:hypothetical protein